MAPSEAYISVRFCFGRRHVDRVLPRPPMCIPVETSSVVQVKYTNPSDRKIAQVHAQAWAGKYASDPGTETPVSYQLLRSRRRPFSNGSLALSGSDQAREGRLVDALAVRGDEGRDTLR